MVDQVKPNSYAPPRWHQYGVPLAIIVPLLAGMFLSGKLTARIDNNTTAIIEKGMEDRRQWSQIRSNDDGQSMTAQRIANIEGQLKHLVGQTNRLVDNLLLKKK